MPVRVRIVAPRDVEIVLELHQARHRVRAAAIHADLAVVIERHEAELRVGPWIHHLQLQPVALGNWLPVRQRRTAQRIDADTQPGGPDRVHVDDVLQVVDIVVDVVFLLRGGGVQRLFERHPPDARVARAQQFIGAVLDGAGHRRVGRSAVRRIVLETAVFGRVVRWRDHDAVRESVRPSAVRHQDGARDHRRRRDTVALLDDGRNPVGGQHLESGPLRHSGKRVRVLAHEERARVTLALSILADGLRDGQNVGFGEGVVGRRAAVSAGAETDHLIGIAGVGTMLEILPFQTRDIDQTLFRRGLSRQFVDGHSFVPASVY